MITQGFWGARDLKDLATSRRSFQAQDLPGWQPDEAALLGIKDSLKSRHLHDGLSSYKGLVEAFAVRIVLAIFFAHEIQPGVESMVDPTLGNQRYVLQDQMHDRCIHEAAPDLDERSRNAQNTTTMRSKQIFIESRRAVADCDQTNILAFDSVDNQAKMLLIAAVGGPFGVRKICQNNLTARVLRGGHSAGASGSANRRKTSGDR